MPSPSSQDRDPRKTAANSPVGDDPVGPKSAGPPVDPPDLTPPERTTTALLMSLGLHVVMLVAIGLIWTSQPSGSGEEPDRPVGIALVHRLPDRDRYETVEPTAAENETESVESPTDSLAAAAAAPPADFQPPLDLDGLLASMESTPAPASGTGLAGETQLDGDAFEGRLGSPSDGEDEQTTAVLFGVSGSGSRFVYVFDRSDSMNGFGGRPLRAAKAELIRSLRTLGDRQRFQLVFYNDKPSPFRLSGLPLQMYPGETSYLNLAENHVRSIAAFGGTHHESALKTALNLAPDVVFFLTDARIPRLSSSELLEIKQRADSVGATIHAIEFGPDPAAPADSFLRQLATQNNGQYRYINVQQLSSSTGSNPGE